MCLVFVVVLGGGCGFLFVGFCVALFGFFCLILVFFLIRLSHYFYIQIFQKEERSVDFLPVLADFSVYLVWPHDVLSITGQGDGKHLDRCRSITHTHPCIRYFLCLGLVFFYVSSPPKIKWRTQGTSILF